MFFSDNNKNDHVFNEIEKYLEITGKWQVGDWEGLIKEDRSILERHPQCNELLAIVACAFLQLGDLEKGKELLIKTKRNEVVKKIILSSVHNTLARAHFLIGNNANVKEHWNQSIGLFSNKLIEDTAVNERMRNEYRRLGCPPYLFDLNIGHDLSDADTVFHVLTDLNKKYNSEPSLLIALAEFSQRNEKYDDAIRFWQELASDLQEATPQMYYDRLDEAYQKQKSFPIGEATEEELTGYEDKHELLKKLHFELEPKLYLEIGVQTGKSLQIAECKAIGIDPMPRPNIKLKENHTLLRMTSDFFFDVHADAYLEQAPELVFIDGMHLFEYALRDFINVEKYSGPDTLVVIDDIFPNHISQASRERKTRAWTGDIWKIVNILESYRPELNLNKIDAHPTGLLIISNLDSENEILQKNYESIKSYWKYKAVPRSVIERKGAGEFNDFFD